jgi:enterochelin esterase-like enzyme
MMGFYDSAESLIANGTIPPFILVMPEGGWASNYTSGGPNAYEAIIVNELIPLIDASYCTANDAAYRAIGGVSRGGYWSLEIGFLYPELFASVGGHSAALYDNGAGPDINPQFTGITNDLGDLRIYFDIGEDDWLIPNIQTLHEEMTQAGIPHVWQLNEGAHADAYWAKHAPDYFQWYAEPWPHARDAYPPCAPLSGGG